jgi:hypothetical protein
MTNWNGQAATCQGQDADGVRDRCRVGMVATTAGKMRESVAYSTNIG